MSRQTPASDARFVERVRRRLDDDVSAFDSETLSRLRRARQRAIAAAGKRSWWRAPWAAHRPAGDWLVPAGAFASIAATALALTLMVSEPDDGIAREVDDLELLTAGEELELYENLEFYQWLGNHEQTG